MASIRRAPRTGRWEVRYRDPAGKQRTKTFSTKADANAFKARIEVQIERGEWRDPALAKISFGAWCDLYFAPAAAYKRKTTLARDQAVTEKHLRPALGRMPLGAITPRDVQNVVDTMCTTLAALTVRTDYAVLRAILAAAVSADRIAASPCRGIRLPPATRKDIRFLGAEELARLANEIRPQYRTMIYVAGVLGLRWSEVAGLRVGRIDFLRRTIEVTETIAEVEGTVEVADVKTKASRRTLAVPPFLIEMLAEHLAEFGSPNPMAHVFTGPSGGLLRVSNFRQRIWKPAVQQAGLTGLTYHGLRHTSVGLMIEVGAHIETIKQRLGHSSIRVTSDIYGSVLPTVDDGVTSALDDLFSTSDGQSESGTEPR